MSWVLADGYTIPIIFMSWKEDEDALWMAARGPITLPRIKARALIYSKKTPGKVHVQLITAWSLIEFEEGADVFPSEQLLAQVMLVAG